MAELHHELYEIEQIHFPGYEKVAPYFIHLQKWAKAYYNILDNLHDKEEKLLKHEKHAIKVLEKTKNYPA